MRRKTPSGVENTAQVLSQLPVYRRLNNAQKTKLQNRVDEFIGEYHLEPCGGLELTPEIQVTIAAYASLLLLGQKSGFYPDLSAILVYPDRYVAPVQDHDEIGVVTAGSEIRSGESWQAGTVVLSWREISANLRESAEGWRSGYPNNLILHEFAHQLDDSFGLTSGVDDYGRATSDDPWAVTLARCYERHCRNTEIGKQTIVDPYGAENIAEFFAVCTEVYFETPPRLKKEYPDLYTHLRVLYEIELS